MTRLHKAVAVRGTIEARCADAIDRVLRLFREGHGLTGKIRTYEPRSGNPDAVPYPTEHELVTLVAADHLPTVQSEFARWLDVVATIDVGNQDARGTIKVGDVVLAEDVPVATLLWLEKTLETRLEPLGRSLPVQSADERWDKDSSQVGVWTGRAVESIKTTKVQEPITLVPPSDKFPAQAQLISRDVAEGTWTTRKLSGALPAERVARYRDNLRRLLIAVREAREEANQQEVKPVAVGDDIMAFLFG